MEFADNLPELIKNTLYLESKLKSKNKLERDKAVSLIKGGINFLKMTLDGKVFFAPSRFIGYKNNSIEGHMHSRPHGSFTNPKIDKIVNFKSEINQQLEIEYRIFCERNSIIPNEKGKFALQRKFWDIDKIETDVYGDLEFPEGKKRYVQHLRRERRPEVRQLAIELFLKKNHRLYCEVCNFDFELMYGTLGKGFIECHHTIPLSKMPKGHKTKIQDIALLCSNCHRMIHKPQTWLTVDELRKTFNKSGSH